MRKLTKAILVCLMVGAMVLTGVWYLLFAPRQASYDEDENRNLAAAPKFSFASFWNGQLSTDLENWLLDRFWGRSGAMDISMSMKDLGSIATYEDSLVILEASRDELTGQEDENTLDDLVNDLFTTPGATQPPEATPAPTPAPTPEGGHSTPGQTPPPEPTPAQTTPGEPAQPETTLPPTTPGPTMSTDLADYPKNPGILLSIGGETTWIKAYPQKNVLAVTSVLSRLAGKLPQGGQLVYTMVPQSVSARAYVAAKHKDFFTSQTEDLVQAFSPANVTAICAADILDEHMKLGEYMYFRTDIHWTPQGTYQVYRHMAAAAGKTPTAWEDFNLQVEENFLGTYYRSDPTDYMRRNPDTLTLVSPKFPVEWRRVTGKDSYKVLPLLDFNARKSDRYTVYLGGPAGPWSYAVSENGETENCLVICDSFGLAFVPMIATNYRQTHYMDPRYFDARVTGCSLTEMMEKYDITDVYVVVGALHTYDNNFITGYLNDQIGK